MWYSTVVRFTDTDGFLLHEIYIESKKTAKECGFSDKADYCNEIIQPDHISLPIN